MTEALEDKNSAGKNRPFKMAGAWRIGARSLDKYFSR